MTNDFAYYQDCQKYQHEDSAQYMLKHGVFLNMAELYKDMKIAGSETCAMPFRKELENGNILDYDILKEDADPNIVTFITALNTDDYENNAILIDMDRDLILGQDIGKVLYEAFQEIMEQENVKTEWER